MVDLVRSIAADTGELVRKEVELAKAELTEAVLSRLKAAIALAVAGIMALMGAVFAALAVAAAVALVLPAWASALIVAGGFLLVATVAGLVGMRRMRRPSLAPERTKRSIKEDVAWARAQLKR